MPTQHVVQQGECVSSIAFQYGFFPDTLWKHPSNSKLRELRKEMHVLLPGDVLNIPDLTEREKTSDPEKRHKFRRKGVPEKLQLQFFDEAKEPVANCPCTVEVDGTPQKLQTDGDGKLELSISPAARLVKVRFDTDKPEWNELEYEFQVGGIDPVTEESGVRQRLRNVGCLDDEMSLEDGVRAFQRMEGLKETGELDADTRSRLKERSTD